jgi:4-hydroxybenzoate polyprenyltransferase
MPPLLKLLRPHQWAKNLLVFVGLLAAHRWGDLDAWQAAAVMFVALSLLASGVYVLNDLLDVAHDRLDPDKCHRPLAAGSVSLPMAYALIPLLALGAGSVALALDASARTALASYAAGALLYNLGAKRVLWVDITLLAGLYALRVVAGALACEIAPSPWLVGFSLFAFLSLAALKRYAELRSTQYAVLPGRAYRADDAPVVLAFGVGAALASAVVLALYVNAADVVRMYRHPELLWALGPIVLTWLARLWTLAQRAQLPGDPVLFALRDRASWLSGLALVLCVLSAA